MLRYRVLLFLSILLARLHHVARFHTGSSKLIAVLSFPDGFSLFDGVSAGVFPTKAASSGVGSSVAISETSVNTAMPDSVADINPAIAGINAAIDAELTAVVTKNATPTDSATQTIHGAREQVETGKTDTIEALDSAEGARQEVQQILRELGNVPHKKFCKDDNLNEADLKKAVENTEKILRHKKGYMKNGKLVNGKEDTIDSSWVEIACPDVARHFSQVSYLDEFPATNNPPLMTTKSASVAACLVQIFGLFGPERVSNILI